MRSWTTAEQTLDAYTQALHKRQATPQNPRKSAVVVERYSGFESSLPDHFTSNNPVGDHAQRNGQQSKANGKMPAQLKEILRCKSECAVHKW
ncbi:hypothetical protein MTsPCn3_03990 [Erythrobacter sp. MTPC3]